MISNSFEAIIFDLGGVIINIDYQRTIDAFKELGTEDFDKLYSQANQTDLFDKFETGKISSQYFINSLLHLLPNGISPNKIVKAWNAMILDVPIEKINLLKNLKEKYPIYLLSNTNEIHVPAVRREWARSTPDPLESFFLKVYFSHEIKLRKPNQDIFNFVCEEQNLQPSKTLFIDDSIQHIEGADKFGLQTLHYTSAESLYQFFS